MGCLFLKAKVELNGKRFDDKHLVSPSDGVLHLEFRFVRYFLGVLSSDESGYGTFGGFMHSLLSNISRSVSFSGLTNFNVLEVEGNLIGTVGSCGISLSLDSSDVHLLGSVLGADEEFGLVSKDVKVNFELVLLNRDKSKPVGDSLLVDHHS